MKRISLILAAALAGFAFAAKADDIDYSYLHMADFGHKIKLQVSGYTGTETLQNFPVLVRLAEYDESTGKGIPGFRYSDMSAKNQGEATGKDLAFFDANGNHLASEIQTNDWTTSGTSLVWVSIPQMQQGTKFYMCYNTSESGVWVTNANPWTEYVGVWHLDESGGENKPVFDSTTNQLHGVNRSTTGARTDGVVGNARRIATSNAHDPGIIVEATNGLKKVAADSLGTDFHASFWMRPQGTKQDWRQWSNLLGRRKGDMGESWGVSIDDKAEGLRIYADKTIWTDGKQQRFVSTARDTKHGINPSNPNSGVSIPPTTSNKFPFLNTNGGAWQKIDVLWKYTTAENSACYEVYSNGVLAAAGPLIGPVSAVPANIGIGCSTQDQYASNESNPAAVKKGRRFYGDMDEVRLRPGIVSADWIKADFDTMKNENFVTFVPPDVLEVTWAEESGLSGVTNVAWNAAVVGGLVTGLGEGASEASIEGKFWVDGDSEPGEWTTLTNGLDALESFEITVPCQANTTYNYKLRGIDNSGETEPITGTFTTLPGLAVTWAEKSSRAGVTNVLSHIVIVGGTIDALDSAPSITIEGKFWNGEETEPSEWTALGEALSQTGDFSFSISGLEIDHLYSYRLQAKGSNGIVVSPASGTFMTGHGLTIHWSGTQEQPGVTNIAWNAVVVGGAVEGIGDEPSCSLEGKFWVDGETEPTEWQTLGAGDFGLGDFSVSVPNLVENTTYRYKLRATETDGSETPAASGMFTTPVGLAATWAGTAGVTNALCFSAVIGGVLDCLGNSATCTVQGKFWVGETEPTEWTTVGEALSQTGDFSVAVSNLTAGTTYNYKLRVLGANGVATVPVSGEFTTLQGLTINWAADSGKTGLSQIAYDFVSIGGTVQILGEATSCAIQYKIWAGDEPDGWETLASGLGLSQNFNSVVNGFAAGTTYSYKLRAFGTDGMPSEIVSGTFTTKGEEGERIGSDDTKFFDDGTNACWVVKGFERYLPFTVTGYSGSETLTNFPVLVEVRKSDTNGFSYDDFYHAGGRDIAFVDEKGHVIPHEIDTWNPNGMSLIWVRLPEMNNGTKFTMCYRSPLVNPPGDPGNTFEKYVGVWHMNETGDGIVQVHDSTVNNLTGETHANSLAYSNGRIGYARRVAQHSGTSSTYGHILINDHDDILRTGVGNVFTYSCWSKLADNKPGWAYLVSRKREDADKGWGVQYTDGDVNSKLRAWSGSTAKGDYTHFNVSGYSHTSWACWTFVYSNTVFRAYLNGVPQSSDWVTLEGVVTHNVNPVANDETADYGSLVIGGQQIGTGALNGWVDECRYSKGIRSADWIKAEYYSTMQATWWQDATKRFVTKGTVSKGDETPVPVVVWETGRGLPVTVIDVSYAYVQFAGTVTYCGANADTCWIEYQLWADGQEPPDEDDWTILLDNATPGTKFSIPVFGLKQDMPYNFRIRAVNEVAGERRQTLEHTGSFRTNGNVNESAADGELMRIDNKFVHLYRAGEYTFTTPDYVTNIEIIVVGGGGAGGYKIGGGGGGGGVYYSQSYGVTTNTTYFITVGRGGTAPLDTETASSDGSGDYSTFSLDSDHEHPLIEVPGGGGGGSCSTTANIAQGGDGASGGGAGGRGDTGTTGMSGGSAVEVEGIVYGHEGGDGNHKQNNGAKAALAAGGGGGGQRDGLNASSDNYFGGGAGGSGVACNMLGETLWFGAGGGGGYAYWEDGNGFSKPGAGGSGIGGNAADVKNGTLATSGVPNTGAGGGGGSSYCKDNSNTAVDDSKTAYWQGGNGGDGVVIISYEVHGRDPVAEEPRISMTRCNYVEEVDEEAGNDVAGIAKIDYRLYWAGVQTDLADIYVHYSTVSSNELDNADGGEWVKVAEASVGIGSLVFTPPAVGYTYWVRLVARKGANSYAQSEEIASFTVPAISLNGATWTESKTSPAEDYATVTYKLHDTNELTHVYCYWSENRADLEGDEPPSGEGVFLLDLGANTNTNLSGKTTFTLPAAEGLERNRTYYIRLVSGDDQGIELFPSEEIMELDTKEMPITVLNGASWADSNVVTVNFKATVGKLDPEEVQLVALYSRVENDVKDKVPEAKESVNTVSLGFCADLGLNTESPSATFPLWSDVVTNYYVRLALATNVVVDVDGVITTNRVIIGGSYSSSSATKSITVSHAVEANTLIYIVTANPKIACYGDAVQTLDYSGPEFAGLTEGWGFNNKYGLTGEIACEVTAASPSGVYPITQGTFKLVDNGKEKKNTVDGVEYVYQYKLTFSRATYTITNAVFTADIEDVVTNYTGEAFDASGLVTTVSGVRNEQPVTYLYRANGAGDWGEMPAFTNVGNYLVQFKASAPNHDEVHSSFKVTVVPAPLTATIENMTMDYTGSAVTPDFVTNVTGLVKGDVNPLTCEFREEAGEWQSEAPSFKFPGTYKIYFRASAPNHETAVTNCTVVVRGWDFMVNMDGATGYQTPIIMNTPNWLIDKSGKTGTQLSDNTTRYDALNEMCANGLRLWQNYVIERKDFSKKVVATIMQQGSTVDPNAFVVHFPDIQPLMGTGLRVQYRLDKKLRRNLTKDEFAAASFEIGELTGKYETNVPLGPHDPTGLYVFNIVFSPTNTQYEGQSVIASCATVGVLRVSSALTNTVTVAPWLSMSVDSTNRIAIAVADVVNPFSIGGGDTIHAYETETGTFRMWERKDDGDWNAPVTVNKKGVSQSTAEESTFEPGKAFWLGRKSPGEYIYLVGRYTGEDYVFDLEGGTAEAPGHTLVANPTMYDVALNDLVFVDGEDNPAKPAAGDRIIFQDASGYQTIYFPHATTKKWGRNVPTKVGRRVQNVWTEDGTNTMGTGFWYLRTDQSTLKIKFGGAQ